MREFDLVVIGAGPGGYEAALEAARVYKMKTALVEKSALGGTCLNRGCIPTKALLHSAAIWRQLKEADHCGISVSGMSADPEKMHQYKDEVTGRLRDGIAAMMKQQKVSVFSGAGMITDAHHVKVTSAGSGEERELETEYILIATGSVVSRPPIPGLDLPGVLTSDELLEKRDSIPEQLVIIGGGVIGMEFAFLYGSLGTKVTVIEALPRILANLDKEISQSLRMQLKKLEVDIHASAAVSKIYQSDDGKLVCEYREKETDQCVTAENILVCTGRRPFTEGLFAEGIDVETNRGRITTDEFGRTSIENVYAIGDVTGKIMLAHAAAAQGRNALAHMNKLPAPIREDLVPSCIYTDPEIACVGMTLEEAKSNGIEAVSRKALMTSNGRSVIAGQDRGYIRVVYEKESGRILGAQMMCENASDLISEFTQAIALGTTLDRMGSVIRPHPSFSEGITDAVRL